MAPPPFTCFLLLFPFHSSLSSSFSLTSSPSSFSLSLASSLFIFPLICPSEVLINYSCLCLSPKPCHLSSTRQLLCILLSCPPPPPLIFLSPLSSLAESSTPHEQNSGRAARVDDPSKFKQQLKCSFRPQA